MKESKLAVVGCGHWGRNLVRNFAEIGVLKCVCDADIEVAKAIAKQFSVVVSGYDEILADPSITAVVVASPPEWHFDLCSKALLAQKHVYVEKPITLDLSDAESLCDLAEKCSRKLMVGHLLLYHPAFIELLARVRAGEIGQLRHIESTRFGFGEVRSHEDALWSFAPHDLSMVLRLTGLMPNRVKREDSFPLQKVPADISTLHLEFHERLTAKVNVSWIHPYKDQKLIVTGSQGMLVFDDMKDWSEKLTLYHYDISSGVELRKLREEKIKLEPSEPLRNECQHFVDVINGEKALMTPGEDGRDVLSVLVQSRKN